MNFHWQQLQKKTPLPCRNQSKVKDVTPPVQGADESTATVPVFPAVLPLPSMSPAPPTIPNTTIIDDTPTISNDVSGINNETIDNASIANKCEEEWRIGEVDDFKTLDIDFHDTNETSMFSPSNKKIKSLTLMTHL